MSSDSGFKWACYVSYRHGQGDLFKDFINELSTALENRLGLMGLGLRVFFDREGLTPPYSITPGLAEAICRSVCMIVVYNNGYFDKNNPYCAKEFSAMVELENERLRANGINHKFSLIIPVLLRRPTHLPDEIFNRSPVDFSSIYTNPERYAKLIRLKNKLKQTMLETAYPNELNRIASTITETYTLLSKLDKDLFARCHETLFPSDEKVSRLLERTTYEPVFPLGKNIIKTALPSNVADLIDDADNAYDKAEYNSAIRLYQRILKLDPENQRAKKNLVEAEKRLGPGDVSKSLPQIAKQYLDQARLHISVRNIEQAISLLKGAIDEAQKKGMKYPDAEQMLGDAENMLLADGFRHKAIIVLQRESWENALSYYKKALLLDPTNIIIKMELERLQNSIPCKLRS